MLGQFTVGNFLINIDMSTRELKDVDLDNLPRHIAIIMDGNGRWAKNRSLPRIAGHREGINSVREITKFCGEINIEYLTLYTFSTENWNRPKKEVNALMNLLLKTIKKEIKDLHNNNVVLSAIGDISALPEKTRASIYDGIKQTSNNTGLNLILALNYGSRQEILDAVQNIGKEIKKGEIGIEHVNEKLFSYF